MIRLFLLSLDVLALVTIVAVLRPGRRRSRSKFGAGVPVERVWPLNNR